MSMKGLFAALAVGAAAIAMPQTAAAEESLDQCRQDMIYAQFNNTSGQTKLFGRDGCIWEVVGAPLAVNNYDMSNPREARQFVSLYQTAERTHNAAIVSQQRQQEYQQRQCNYSVDSVLGSVLGGRAINPQTAITAARNCRLGQ